MYRLKLRNGTLTAIALVMVGITYLVLFASAGSFLDEEGVLHEPFFLLPMGYLLIFLGGVVWTVARTLGLLRRFLDRRN